HRFPKAPVKVHLKSPMKSFQSNSLAALVIMTLFYLALSPYIYFRHDDWLMLGNAVSILPHDWSFLWKPTWFTSPKHEEIWFFRPLFKGIIWAAYQLFSFNSVLWTLSHWVFIVIGTLIGGKTLFLLNQDPKRPDIFMTLVFCSLSVHFASVVWVGEGMMNAPQIFLLMLSSYLFVRNTLLSSVSSLFVYFLALGLKESSVFLPIFLLAISISQKQYLQRKPFHLVQFTLMFFFLVFRLGILPFNPGYSPHFSWDSLAKPIIYFSAILLMPFLTLVSSHLRVDFLNRNSIKNLVLFSPFVVLLVGPHLGHSFFSPGWFLLPGFFSIWIFVYCLDVKHIEKLTLHRWALSLFILSALPVAWQINRIQWLEWNHSQKEVHRFIKEVPDTVKGIYIETCSNPIWPEITFQRVIGAQENLEHMWNLHHKSPITIRLLPCAIFSQAIKLPDGFVLAKWNFPEFSTQ
ncbi:MAG: hypothetical protein ACKN9V_08170, partial [Pseudomonadota bacterium]